MKPIRIQRKRTKGWKMPPNTVYVGRPTKWGNPFDWQECRDEFGCSEVKAKETTKGIYCEMVMLALSDFPERPTGIVGHLDTRLFIKQNIGDLRGKNLACFCALDEPCHADVLLEVANRPEAKQRKALFCSPTPTEI